ncbi:MAG TPA: hypothetical protein VGM91_05595 [Conexibacter sp.]|jgi:hypothetical protein
MTRGERLVYFGHLSERSTSDIARALAEVTPAEQRRQLSEKLQIAGAVCLRERSWLQRSLASPAIGTILLVIAYTAF